MTHADGDVVVCSACGHEQPRDDSEDGDYVTTEAQDDSDVIETSADAADEGMPTAEVSCEECGAERAWYTIKQTGAADEPPTRFFKCTECGHRWREYN